MQKQSWSPNIAKGDTTGLLSTKNDGIWSMWVEGDVLHVPWRGSSEKLCILAYLVITEWIWAKIGITLQFHIWWPMNKCHGESLVVHENMAKLFQPLDTLHYVWAAQLQEVEVQNELLTLNQNLYRFTNLIRCQLFPIPNHCT